MRKENTKEKRKKEKKRRENFQTEVLGMKKESLNWFG